MYTNGVGTGKEYHSEGKMLKFSRCNAKLAKLAPMADVSKHNIMSLDLLSGHSCPFAKECKSKAVQTPNGLRIQDGPHCKHRCYSASQEAFYKYTYKLRKHNFDYLRKLKTAQAICKAITVALPRTCKVLRFHTAGEYFSYRYFVGMVLAAKAMPDVIFYGYTKAAPFVKRYIDEHGKLPRNFRLILSYGGTQDNMYEDLPLYTAKVVYSEDEAKEKGLPIDHDDSHAFNPHTNFAIVLHGYQPAGSDAAKAIAKMKREGTLSKYQYNRKVGGR